MSSAFENERGLPPAQRNMSAAARAAAADALLADQEPRAAKRIKPDPTMTVTTPELDRSRQVAAAAVSHEKIAKLKERQIMKGHKVSKLTDYDYAQQAIVADSEDSIDDIVHRLYKLQCFREEYRILDTVEEGVSLIQKLMEIMPGYLLSVDFAPRYGSYIFVWDFAAFQPSNLQDPDKMRIFMGALYYIFQCLSTNLKAARSGVVFITECQGMTSENFDFQTEQKVLAELLGHYPFKHKECLWLNTPVIANVAYGLLKPLVKKDFLATWRMGCKLDGYEGRVDALFKQPTLAIAQEQLLKKVEGFLTERAQNVRNFELTEKMVANPPPEGQAQQAPVPAAAAARGPRPPMPAGAARPRPGMLRPGMRAPGAMARPGMVPRPAGAAAMMARGRQRPPVGAPRQMMMNPAASGIAQARAAAAARAAARAAAAAARANANAAADGN